MLRGRGHAYFEHSLPLFSRAWYTCNYIVFVGYHHSTLYSIWYLRHRRIPFMLTELAPGVWVALMVARVLCPEVKNKPGRSRILLASRNIFSGDVF